MVIIKRTKFELEEAEQREHILEGLKKALENIDNVILYPCQHISCRKCIDTLRNNNPCKITCPQCRAQILCFVDFFSNSVLSPKASCPYEDCKKYGVEYNLIDLRKHINTY